MFAIIVHYRPDILTTRLSNAMDVVFSITSTCLSGSHPRLDGACSQPFGRIQLTLLPRHGIMRLRFRDGLSYAENSKPRFAPGDPMPRVSAVRYSAINPS